MVGLPVRHLEAQLVRTTDVVLVGQGTHGAAELGVGRAENFDRAGAEGLRVGRLLIDGVPDGTKTAIPTSKVRPVNTLVMRALLAAFLRACSADVSPPIATAPLLFIKEPEEEYQDK